MGFLPVALLHFLMTFCYTFILPKTVIGISFQHRGFIVIPERISFVEPFMRGVVGQHNDNAGLWTVIWGEADFPINISSETGFQLAQKVFGITGAYTTDSLKEFFAECDIWEIDPALFDLSRSTNYRVYGSYLANLESTLSLAYSAETLLKIKRWAVPG